MWMRPAQVYLVHTCKWSIKAGIGMCTQLNSKSQSLTSTASFEQSQREQRKDAMLVALLPRHCGRPRRADVLHLLI